MYIGTQLKNDVSYRSDEDENIMKVNNGVMTLMKAEKIVGNFCKMVESTIVGKVASVESDNDATIL